MINFLKTWCENIVVVLIISVIIEMILPEGKNKKYVQVIIGIYIIFTILNPIFTNINIKNIDLKEVLKMEDTRQVSAENNKDEIRKIYIDAIKRDIKYEIEALGFEVCTLDLKTDMNFENIEKILIVANKKSNSITNNISINEIKVNIQNEVKNKNELEEKDKNIIKNKILSMYEIEEKNIVIN